MDLDDDQGPDSSGPPQLGPKQLTPPPDHPEQLASASSTGFLTHDELSEAKPSRPLGPRSKRKRQDLGDYRSILNSLESQITTDLTYVLSGKARWSRKVAEQLVGTSNTADPSTASNQLAQDARDAAVASTSFFGKQEASSDPDSFLFHRAEERSFRWPLPANQVPIPKWTLGDEIHGIIERVWKEDRKERGLMKQKLGGITRADSYTSGSGPSSPSSRPGTHSSNSSSSSHTSSSSIIGSDSAEEESISSSGVSMRSSSIEPRVDSASDDQGRTRAKGKGRQVEPDASGLDSDGSDEGGDPVSTEVLEPVLLSAQYEIRRVFEFLSLVNTRSYKARPQRRRMGLGKGDSTSGNESASSRAKRRDRYGYSTDEQDVLDGSMDGHCERESALRIKARKRMLARAEGECSDDDGQSEADQEDMGLGFGSYQRARKIIDWRTVIAALVRGGGPDEHTVQLTKDGEDPCSDPSIFSKAVSSTILRLESIYGTHGLEPVFRRGETSVQGLKMPDVRHRLDVLEAARNKTKSFSGAPWDWQGEVERPMERPSPRQRAAFIKAEEAILGQTALLVDPLPALSLRPAPVETRKETWPLPSSKPYGAGARGVEPTRPGWRAQLEWNEQGELIPPPSSRIPPEHYKRSKKRPFKSEGDRPDLKSRSLDTDEAGSSRQGSPIVGRRKKLRRSESRESRGSRPRPPGGGGRVEARKDKVTPPPPNSLGITVPHEGQGNTRTSGLLRRRNERSPPPSQVLSASGRPVEETRSENHTYQHSLSSSFARKGPQNEKRSKFSQGGLEGYGSSTSATSGGGKRKGRKSAGRSAGF